MLADRVAYSKEEMLFLNPKHVPNRSNFEYDLLHTEDNFLKTLYIPLCIKKKHEGNNMPVGLGYKEQTKFYGSYPYPYNEGSKLDNKTYSTSLQNDFKSFKGIYDTEHQFIAKNVDNFLYNGYVDKKLDSDIRHSYDLNSRKLKNFKTENDVKSGSSHYTFGGNQRRRNISESIVDHQNENPYNYSALKHQNPEYTKKQYYLRKTGPYEGPISKWADQLTSYPGSKNHKNIPAYNPNLEFITAPPKNSLDNHFDFGIEFDRDFEGQAKKINVRQDHHINDPLNKASIITQSNNKLETSPVLKPHYVGGSSKYRGVLPAAKSFFGPVSPIHRAFNAKADDKKLTNFDIHEGLISEYLLLRRQHCNSSTDTGTDDARVQLYSLPSYESKEAKGGQQTLSCPENISTTTTIHSSPSLFAKSELMRLLLLGAIDINTPVMEVGGGAAILDNNNHVSSPLPLRLKTIFDTSVNVKLPPNDETTDTKTVAIFNVTSYVTLLREMLEEAQTIAATATAHSGIANQNILINNNNNNKDSQPVTDSGNNLTLPADVPAKKKKKGKKDKGNLQSETEEISRSSPAAQNVIVGGQGNKNTSNKTPLNQSKDQKFPVITTTGAVDKKKNNSAPKSTLEPPRIQTINKATMTTEVTRNSKGTMTSVSAINIELNKQPLTSSSSNNNFNNESAAAATMTYESSASNFPSLKKQLTPSKMASQQLQPDKTSSSKTLYQELLTDPLSKYLASKPDNVAAGILKNQFMHQDPLKCQFISEEDVILMKLLNDTANLSLIEDKNQQTAKVIPTTATPNENEGWRKIPKHGKKGKKKKAQQIP